MRIRHALLFAVAALAANAGAEVRPSFPFVASSVISEMESGRRSLKQMIELANSGDDISIASVDHENVPAANLYYRIAIYEAAGMEKQVRENTLALHGMLSDEEKRAYISSRKLSNAPAQFKMIMYDVFDDVAARKNAHLEFEISQMAQDMTRKERSKAEMRAWIESKVKKFGNAEENSWKDALESFSHRNADESDLARIEGEIRNDPANGKLVSKYFSYVSQMSSESHRNRDYGWLVSVYAPTNVDDAANAASELRWRANDKSLALHFMTLAVNLESTNKAILGVSSGNRLPGSGRRMREMCDALNLRNSADSYSLNSPDSRMNTYNPPKEPESLLDSDGSFDKMISYCNAISRDNRDGALACYAKMVDLVIRDPNAGAARNSRRAVLDGYINLLGNSRGNHEIVRFAADTLPKLSPTDAASETLVSAILSRARNPRQINDRSSILLKWLEGRTDWNSSYVEKWLMRSLIDSAEARLKEPTAKALWIIAKKTEQPERRLQAVVDVAIEASQFNTADEILNSDDAKNYLKGSPFELANMRLNVANGKLDWDRLARLLEEFNSTNVNPSRHTLVNVAVSAALNSRNDIALAFWKKAVENDPGFTPRLMELAGKSKELNQALVEHYEGLLRDMPDSSTIRDALEMVRQAGAGP